MNSTRLLAAFAVAVSAFAQADNAAKPKTPASTAKPKTSPAPAQPKTSTATPTPASNAGLPGQLPPAAGGPAAASVPPNTPVLTIGTEKVTAAEFDAFINSLPEQVKAQAQGPGKRQLAEQYARMKVLSSEARKRGLDQDPTVKARMALQSENILAGAVYTDLMSKAAVDDAAVKSAYEKSKENYEEIEARHILIRFKGSAVPLGEGKQELSEDQALAKVTEIRKKLAAGEDFAALAKAESDDRGSGDRGGELGPFKRGQMVEAFQDAAFKLPVGQVSEPVKTQFGYHLIRVDKHNTTPFDEARKELEARMRPEKAREALESMVTAANVIYDETYFGAAPAPLAPAPGTAPSAPKP